MSDIAIRVERLSKLYRIGASEQRHETLVGAVVSFLKSPLQNYRDLRKLSSFDDVKAENGRSKIEDGAGGFLSPASPSDVIWALRDVSFEVKHGEVLGLIGRNGAGKSTLLKILARITEPTSGRAEINGRVGSLLEVGTGFHPDLTGRENIYLNGTILGMKKREIDTRFDEIVDFSGIEEFIDTPVKRYSSGMRVRLAFSVAAHLKPEILLVDEVLAVGDAEFQKKCLGKMGEVAKGGRTVLFVSHQMEAILNLCPRCFLFAKGSLVFQGDSEEAVRLYLGSLSGQSTQRAAHVVYEGSEAESSQSPRIHRIELLDASLSPKAMIYTWDEVVFRLHYVSDQTYKHGSFILDICDYRQQRLLAFDSGSRFQIEKGSHYIDCRLPCLPLAAGEFYLGAGLAVSNAQMLWREANAAVVNVSGKDVFASGRPPTSRHQGFALRSLFAVPHEWRK